MNASPLLGSILAFIAILTSNCGAQETLQPLPNGSSNAALHYQRAILLLSGVDAQQRKVLQAPIWETVTPQMTAAQQSTVTQLLFAGRHAIRAGVIGSRQTTADFGIDFSAYGSAVYLPHAQPLQEVANLVALYGMHLQGEEKWADAGEMFLNVVRMGRHLTEQRTLGESTKGIRILETGYYCLATWAARCPDNKLIASVRQGLLAVGVEEISPLAALSTEATIVDLRLSELQHAYPDGNWPEILLAAKNISADSAPGDNWQEFAKAELLKRGIPATVFASPEQFDKFVVNLRDTNRRYYADTLAALSLPPQQAIAAGTKVHGEFADQLKRLGEPDALSPAQISAFYTTHDMAHRLLSVTLALCAAREEGTFPADLNGLATKFGGELPASPLGQALEYQTSADRKGFRIAFPKVMVGDVEVPEVAFEYNFVATERSR
jgi:hypothetical protein